MELGPAGSVEQPRTRAEVLDKMEERAGLKGRALLASFLEQMEQMDKMEKGENGRHENGVSAASVALWVAQG
jgi:hypothetical protein